MVYLMWSLRYGRVAGSNPWGAVGLEWTTTSPPPTENFADDAGRHLGCVRLSSATVERSSSPDAVARGDAHHPALAHQFDSLGQQTEAATLGMWVFLVTEVLFFGGLFADLRGLPHRATRRVRRGEPRARRPARRASTPRSSSPAA